jgi:hypothetical protein
MFAQVRSALELQAKAIFRCAKTAVISRLGRRALSDNILETEGRTAFGRRWLGVFRQDQFKPVADRYAILNTARTENSGGVHWVAVYVSRAGVTYFWDSFGRNTNAVMWAATQKARDAGHNVVPSDRDGQQRGSSEVCGQLSIAWLLVVRDFGVRVAGLV